jgi:hypothetical protein
MGVTSPRGAVLTFRRAAVSACALAATLCCLATARSAEAASDEWNCGSIPPNSWCRYLDMHTFGYVQAFWGGPGGAIWRCAKLDDGVGSSPGIYAYRCAHASFTDVYSNSDGRAPYPNNFVLMRALVANGNNANSWEVWGHATW